MSNPKKIIHIPKLTNLQRSKYTRLLNSFENKGYSPSQSLDQNEYRLFLNDNSSSGYFDPMLCDQLFQFLSLNEKSSMHITKFIEGFILFEEGIRKKANSFRVKLSKEQEKYNRILKNCIKYKDEKLNKEGFSKEAKIYGEITDMDIRQELKGIKEIIILVLFNEEKEELHCKIGGFATNFKKSFEFRPTSRNDRFEFIMKGINDSGKEFNIGSKIFPLTEVESREKYLVQITVPDLENPERIAAYINLNIILYMAFFNYYEGLRKKQEKKINKDKIEAFKYFDNLKNINNIYENISANNFNINEGFYTQREISPSRIPLDSKNSIKNSQRFLSPIIERKKMEYNYVNKYHSPIKINHIKNNQLFQRGEEINIMNINNMNKTQRISNNFYLNSGSNINLDKKINNIKIISHNNKEEKQQFNISNQSQNNKIYINQIEKNNLIQNKAELNKNIDTQFKLMNNSNQISTSKITTQKNIIIPKNIKKLDLNNLHIEKSEKISRESNNAKIDAENEKKEITEYARASVHQIIGEIIKQKTITTETKILEPIIKQVINLKNSINKAIITEKINKEIVEEKTLPVSYLKEKINESINYNKIITLPVINVGNKITYKTFSPMIHKLKLSAEENNSNKSQIFQGNYENLNYNNNANSVIIMKQNNNSINYISPQNSAVNN